MSISLVCDPTAIAAEHRAAHQALAQRLMVEAVQEVRELSDGFAFRFTADEFPAVTAYMAHERLCCPFFAFAIEVGAERDPIWLRITGSDEVKALLQAQVRHSAGSVMP